MLRNKPIMFIPVLVIVLSYIGVTLKHIPHTSNVFWALLVEMLILIAIWIRGWVRNNLSEYLGAGAVSLISTMALKLFMR